MARENLFTESNFKKPVIGQSLGLLEGVVKYRIAEVFAIAGYNMFVKPVRKTDTWDV